MPHRRRRNRALACRFNAAFNRGFGGFLSKYDKAAGVAVRRPAACLLVFAVVFVASLAIYPSIEMAFFPRTDSGQFVMNVKAPSGTRLENTEARISQLEALVRRIVPESELEMMVSNIGVDPGFPPFILRTRPCTRRLFR
ncbi:MAG: efflux RND transporter permease subunit [Paludibaculum sp.]